MSEDVQLGLLRRRDRRKETEATVGKLVEGAFTSLQPAYSSKLAPAQSQVGQVSHCRELKSVLQCRLSNSISEPARIEEL